MVKQDLHILLQGLNRTSGNLPNLS